AKFAGDFAIGVGRPRRYSGVAGSHRDADDGGVDRIGRLYAGDAEIGRTAPTVKDFQPRPMVSNETPPSPSAYQDSALLSQPKTLHAANRSRFHPIPHECHSDPYAWHGNRRWSTVLAAGCGMDVSSCPSR